MATSIPPRLLIIVWIVAAPFSFDQVNDILPELPLLFWPLNNAQTIAIYLQLTIMEEIDDQHRIRRGICRLPSGSTLVIDADEEVGSYSFL